MAAPAGKPLVEFSIKSFLKSLNHLSLLYVVYVVKICSGLAKGWRTTP